HVDEQVVAVADLAGGVERVGARLLAPVADARRDGRVVRVVQPRHDEVAYRDAVRAVGPIPAVAADVRVEREVAEAAGRRGEQEVRVRLDAEDGTLAERAVLVDAGLAERAGREDALAVVL